MRRRLPRHVGLIPDGNRRWAQARGLAREWGYASGIAPGLALFEQCRALGIEELSVYGYTKDNCKRPGAQKAAFRAACVELALELERRGAALLAVGDESSAQFPPELRRFRRRSAGDVKVNLLVNYGWDWDLGGLRNGDLRSRDVPRLDLIVRWGGGRRLSGFLPVQAVYADFYVVDDYWPDFRPTQFHAALDWFENQDQTLGG
ncbi:undecaprenyl diphosphate synthase family protein [Ectothiorhodospiraceae bacterium 2226]|nr:undecaprenyl diphosphate synthase family protein [Ectothiorhodospiraceae bacterium 2226]